VGPYITIGTVVVVLVAACLTLFGLGAFDRAVAVYDPTAWLFSKAKGELGRVNGNTARVDTRVKVKGTTGHRVEVSQTDRYLIVRDLDTGVVSSLDLATLQIAASLQTPPGEGVRFVLHGSAAYVIDEVHGQVRQVDPLTLKPIGAPLSFSPGIAGGEFDSDGKLWLALPSEGTVVSVTPAAKDGEQPAVQTESVAQPSHDLAVSVLDRGVAVLDQTADQLVTVHGTQVVKTALELPEEGLVAARTSGDQVPVTVPDKREVQAVHNPSVSQFTVPGSGNSLSPAVAWAGWYYIADDSTDEVYVLNQAGHLVDQIQFPGQTGDLELQVRDDYLYINSVDGTTARVINRSHKISTVDKYPNDVPGGDPPPVPPAPPAPPKTPPPATPQAGPPGAPNSVVASAGNARVHLTWGAAPANGSRILRYVVEGNGQTYTAGTGQRALDITGLTNGQTYTFSVHAVNAKGDGPPRDSNPVVPTAEVPDPPASVAAHEQKDGTVTVSWPAGAGQGHKVASYQVTATGPDGPVQTWQVSGSKTSFVTPAGPPLTYGTQYAFSVTTVNDQGAGSKPSPLSNSVVPYAVPAAPTNARAVTGAKSGVVTVSWAAPASNGRPITGYVVSYAGKTKSVSGATKVDLTGLTGGQSVTVTVAAVNAAGTGPKSKSATAAAIGTPTLTLGKVSVTYNTITVAFTANDGGGTATCSLVAGASSKKGSCSSLTVSGLAPGVKYAPAVTVSNEVGSKKLSTSATTTVLRGTVTCVNQSGSSYCTKGPGIYNYPAQQDKYAIGNAKNGTRYQAYCQIAGGTNTQSGGGTSLNGGPYNNYKTSSRWVKISTGAKYIPFTWFNLDAGDDLSLLPDC
jgi:predicted RNA-binding protein with TRAM domain